jgi:hypothetical protein
MRIGLIVMSSDRTQGCNILITARTLDPENTQAQDFLRNFGCITATPNPSAPPVTPTTTPAVTPSGLPATPSGGTDTP